MNLIFFFAETFEVCFYFDTRSSHEILSRDPLTRSSFVVYEEERRCRSQIINTGATILQEHTVLESFVCNNLAPIEDNKHVENYNPA